MRTLLVVLVAVAMAGCSHKPTNVAGNPLAGTIILGRITFTSDRNIGEVEPDGDGTSRRFCGFDGQPKSGNVAVMSKVISGSCHDSGVNYIEALRKGWL